MRLLVTGGCGFIGSHFIRRILQADPAAQIVNLDALTYAGNLENLADVERDPRYRFVRGRIEDPALVKDLLGGPVDAVVNFAAESHVDRSLHGPEAFVTTNLLGALVLLEEARRRSVPRFVQVSTDEVYGSIDPPGRFTESSPLNPSSPYSASKAAADLMAGAVRHTHGLDVVITRSSNNYGPFQHPEKFIPLFVTNALEGRECPLYGDGLNVREWIYVEDNVLAIEAALRRGRPGAVYNIGSGDEHSNREIAGRILGLAGRTGDLVRTVVDRPGHDRRYALDSSRARAELGWSPQVGLEEGLRRTVDWYRSHPDWVRRVKSGEYQRYYEMHYHGQSPPIAS